jgi:hypothetical protein
MSRNVRLILAALGAVVMVAAAAVGYLLLAPAGDPKIAEYVNDKRPIGADTEARTLPNATAPVAAMLHRGLSVTVNGLVEGRDWAQIVLPDQRIAYVPATLVSAAPAPAPTAAEPPPEAPPIPADQVATPVAFDKSDDTYRVVTTTGAYIEPDRGAPQKYPVEAGTLVQAMAKTKDGVWVWVDTEDHKPAFLVVADLEIAKNVVPDEAPAAPALPDAVDGAAVVVNTGMLSIQDQQVVLAGVVGETGNFVPLLQQLITARGGSVQCKRAEDKYVCLLPQDIDLARVALFNGLAKPSDDASPDYKAQSDAARTGRRGVWATSRN